MSITFRFHRFLLSLLVVGAVLLSGGTASAQSKKTSGFCFIPQVGITYIDDSFTGVFGVKGAYAKRWGAGLYVSKSPYWGFGFGRKMDDVAPMLSNTELKVFAVKPFSNDFQIVFAATLNF